MKKQLFALIMVCGYVQPVGVLDLEQAIKSRDSIQLDKVLNQYGLIDEEDHLQDLQKLDKEMISYNVYSIDFKEKVSAGILMLYVALEQGRYKVASYLLENGVDVNEPFEHGLSVLTLAAKELDLKAVRFLIEHGAIELRP